MTTKVVIACPDNSLHNALVYIEQQEGSVWKRSNTPVVIEPRTTAAPMYLTSSTRIVIEEDDKNRPEQPVAPPPAAAPKK